MKPARLASLLFAAALLAPAHAQNPTPPAIALWSGEPGYKDGFGKQAQLPSTFVIDKGGKIVERYQGRIPAEAWDKIADLL